MVRRPRRRYDTGSKRFDYLKRRLKVDEQAAAPAPKQAELVSLCAPSDERSDWTCRYEALGPARYEQDWTRPDELDGDRPTTWDALEVCRRELVAAQDQGVRPFSDVVFGRQQAEQRPLRLG